MNEFLQGFIKGAMETPKAFFAPAIAFWRLLIGVSESLTRGSGRITIQTGADSDS